MAESGESKALVRTDLHRSILDAALQQFVAVGYHGASMREIARESGASKALLYYHFENKADIYFGLLIQCMQDLGEIVDVALNHAAALERMRVLLQGILAWPAEKRSLITRAPRDVVHLGQEQRDEFMEKFHRSFISRIETILEEGMQRGELLEADPVLAAQLFFGMAMAPMIPEELRTDDSEKLVDLILQIFFNGLSAKQ